MATSQREIIKYLKIFRTLYTVYVQNINIIEIDSRVCSRNIAIMKYLSMYQS